MRDLITDGALALARPAGLAALEREITESRRALRELWRKASTADRIFATDRLLREGLLDVATQSALASVQDRVRDCWVTARVASALHASVPADARLASLNLMIAERDRDALLDGAGGFDALFVAAEGFLRSVPLVGGNTFRELLHDRERMRAMLVPILPPLDVAAND